MRKIRKPVSILLSLVMILSMFTIIPVSVQAAEVCTDTLTVDDTGATRTNYVSWTAQSGEDHPNISSDAVYAGDSAKGNNGIQMRSKSQSGIVSTGSGGKVRKVTVAWVDTYQNDDRELAVYGSNSAYSSAADLYTDGARGDLLDTFCYNAASYSEEKSVYYNVLETADDYRYIGLRSRSGALYLASVTVDWEIPQAGRVWDWADDYSAATCTFTDESGSYTETASVTSEVTKEPTYIEEGVLTHTAVVTYDGVNYRDVQTEAIPRLEFAGSVPYIDENGIQQDSPAGTMLLTGAETELTSGWYAAASNTTVDDIKVSGNVKIILCDGVTVKAASMSTFRVSGSNDKLTFYGQEDNSGAIGDVNSYCTVEGKGELTVNGGTFCKCGLRAGSSMTINGGKINDASGNVTLYCPNGTLTVNGGDVYCSAGNECVDCNSFVYNGGVFNGRSSFTGVYCRGESATFSWKYENDSVYFSQLGCWKLIDIMSNTSEFEGFSVTLLKDFVDKNGNKYPAGNYNSWDLRYTTLYPDVDKWQILQQRIDASQSGDVITLKSDYKASSDNTALVVPQEKGVLTIDLNGHTIDRGLSSKDAVADGNVITNHATELHIIDSSRSKSGRITGGNNTGDGGGIISDVNTLELNGVTVSGNKSAGNGGGIWSNSVVVLNDSTVKENRAGGSGGGIYCSRNHHNNKINVSGSVNVTGNTKSDGTADNVYFSGSQNIIQVTGQLASGSRIGVGTSVQNQTITSGLNGKGTAANFTSDKKGYLVTLTSGGEAKLAKAYVIHFDPNGGSGEMDDIVTLDTTVTMPECTFTAPEGKRFKAWSDGYGNDSIQEDEEIGISSGIYEYTISAVWADIRTITVDQPEHGSIRANKNEAIEGERVRLTATPEEGYRLHHFTVTYGNGQTVNVNNNSYFFMPDADVTVSVTWAQEHTITVSCGSHGTASADKDIAVEGETVTVMFQPDEDYELDAIKVTDSEDSEIDVGDDHSFGMPDSDVIVTVSFKHAASEHTADKMTRHEAITPTYNSENGSYINGCVEYYVCPVCSGCFVEENGSFVKKNASELIVPYFRFRSVTSEGHQQCVILDYNGTDADVVIPETVPAGYPDSSQIGNTVTGIDHNAFKDKTFVTNVTIGDGLNSICESAFEGCTGLRTVTIGSGLNRIGKDAFKGCSALESFTTTSTNSIQYQYSPGYGDESAGQFSFDPDTEVVFHAPHNSSLLYAAIDYDTAFSATDRHDEPTWNWSYDYSSATAIFNCERDCQMKFDEYPATVTQDGDHVSASVTIDGEIYTDVLSDLPEIETVSYIDEKGETKSVRAIVLTGDEQKEYRSYGIGTGYAYRIQLGKVNNNSPFDQTPEDSWYVVKDNVSYTESLNCYLELMGNVHIIVADGATLNVKSDITGDILSVYGQTGQTGRVTAGYVDCGTVNVCSGGLSVNGNVNCDKLAIYGGTTDITGAVDVDESLLLGCAGANDSITIGSPAKDSDASAAVVTGQVLTDGSREYSGELFDPDLSAMAGKTLVKVHEHNTANDYMTYHAAVAPTYNSAANTYTGGTVEHYDCSICGGHFVLEDNQLVSKTDEELVVLYFVFQGNPIPGYTDQCWVHEYNGTDADVIITDTVPADYPVSSLRGKTVIAVDGKAFKDKSYITSITTGDALARIYSSAFEDCTSLETVTVGSGLDSIDTDAFKGCTALKSFISSSTEDITFSHNTDDPEHPLQSFDIGTEVVFRGPHGSSLLAIADYYDTTFSPTDRHVNPVWTWAADYCSATATFACSGCQLDGDEKTAAIMRDGTVYTATVTVDGKDYTDTVNVAESAAAMIAPDHYYADFRSAIIAAHDTYNDAVIELLKDTSFTWDPELCKNYPSFTVKRNSHTLDYTSHPCYPVSITDDSADVATYTANADHTELTLRSVLNESDGEYSIIMFFLCGICGERIDETTYEAEKHAAKAATCTETGNIEYYIISEELGSTVITYYYVLADTPEYENEVTCIVDDEIASVTVPIDPNAHQIINDPEWSWTGSDSDGYTAAAATFTCSRCSATETVTDTAVTSKTNDGSITYTATVEFEGKTYTASKQVFDDGIGARLVGHSISLDGDIAVNFYMELADDVANSDTAYMQFTIPNGNKTEIKTMRVKDARVENGYHIFKCSVAAKDMNSEISAQLIDGDKTSTVYKYSVKEYADYLIEHQDDNQTFKEAVPLVEAMLKYGTYANNYFSDANALEELAVNIPEKAYTETALPEGVTFDGATLSLKSQTTLSLYFMSEQDITLSIDGADYELDHKGNEYVIRIRNISAAELNDDFTVTVTSNGQSGTVTYSPMTYCYKAQNSSDTKLANTVKALYLYWQAADLYWQAADEYFD